MDAQQKKIDTRVGRKVLRSVLSAARFERLRRSYWNAFIFWDKAKDVARFLTNTALDVSLFQRSKLVKQYYDVSSNVDCPHVPEEIFAYVENILTLPDTVQGCVVEAGCSREAAQRNSVGRPSSRDES